MDLRTSYVSFEEGKWHARLDFKNAEGKALRLKRVASPSTKEDAERLRQQLVNGYLQNGAEALRIKKTSTGRSTDGAAPSFFEIHSGTPFQSEMLLDAFSSDEPVIETFQGLAEWYTNRYLRSPVYVDGRKVAGLRSWQDGVGRLKPLIAHFGSEKLCNIRYRHIEYYKLLRLATPTERHRRQRSITSVNRELEILRRMLNIAKREGWIRESPFKLGDALISRADEKKRQRIISYTEEERLLRACTGQRAHLRDIIIFAVDMGLRRGEIFRLRWRNIDFDSKTVIVDEINSKTAKERGVGMTDRVEELLRRLFLLQGRDKPDNRVFNITTDIKKSFHSARIEAGLGTLRFHDLRHTYCSRLVEAGIPIAEAMKTSGHSQTTTFLRYVGANSETLRRSASALDALRRSKTKQ